MMHRLRISIQKLDNKNQISERRKLCPPKRAKRVGSNLRIQRQKRGSLERKADNSLKKIESG
jgi:hypothetical protein